MKKSVLPFAIAANAVLGLGLMHSAWAQGVLPAKVPVPQDDPMTPAKIALGKQLYFDPRLSLTGTVSCNSCHNLMTNGTDNRSVSTGVRGALGSRNSPTVFNAAFHSVQFWDGRAATLEDQAKGPIGNPVEMGMPHGSVEVARVKQIPGYRPEFEKVFGDNNPITLDNITKAIATFERTLVTPDSPYDRFVQGDKDALSPAAQHGLALVQSNGCTACHSGALFNGPQLPSGTGFYMKFPKNVNSAYVKKYDLMADPGRYAVTHKPADKHMWSVQSWRNIALTAPYFHNGSVQTLPEAVRVMESTETDKQLTDTEVADIVAFLNSLTGQPPIVAMPRLPETPGATVIPSGR